MTKSMIPDRPSAAELRAMAWQVHNAGSRFSEQAGSLLKDAYYIFGYLENDPQWQTLDKRTRDLFDSRFRELAGFLERWFPEDHKSRTDLLNHCADVMKAQQGEAP